MALEFEELGGGPGAGLAGRAAWTFSLNKHIPAALEGVKLLASISAWGGGQGYFRSLSSLREQVAGGRGSPDKGGHSSSVFSCPQPPKAESRVPKPQSSCQPPVFFLRSQTGAPPPPHSPRPPQSEAMML